MKKVLIVAYHFPPENAIGALRPMGLVRHLPRHGWEPLVLTARHGDRTELAGRIRLFETDPFDLSFLGRRRSAAARPAPGDGPVITGDPQGPLKAFLKSLLAFPDRNNGWYLAATRRGHEVVRTCGADAVLSTSPPMTAALVARRLCAAHRIPWAADLRDLWTQYHRYPYGRLRKALETRLERWTLGQASVVTVVSDVRAAKLRTLHPGTDVRDVTLGFDEDDFRGTVPERDPGGRFVVTHAGKLKGRQDAGPFLRALAELLAEGVVDPGRVRVDFWGLVSRNVPTQVAELGLERVVAFHPTIPRREVVPKLQGSQLLLLCQWNDPAETGIHPGKLFDYLGARVPVLSVGDHADVASRVVEETGAGVRARDVHEAKAHLAALYRAFLATGSVPYGGREVEIRRYSYEAIAARFARILDEACGGRR